METQIAIGFELRSDETLVVGLDSLEFISASIQGLIEAATTSSEDGSDAGMVLFDARDAEFEGMADIKDHEGLVEVIEKPSVAMKGGRKTQIESEGDEVGVKVGEELQGVQQKIDGDEIGREKKMLELVQTLRDGGVEIVHPFLMVSHTH